MPLIKADSRGKTSVCIEDIFNKIEEKYYFLKHDHKLLIELMVEELDKDIRSNRGIVTTLLERNINSGTIEDYPIDELRSGVYQYLLKIGISENQAVNFVFYAER